MDLIDLFPTTIAKVKLNSLNIEEAKDHILKYDLIYAPGDGAYSSKQNILSENFFNEIRKEIEFHCHSYALHHGHNIDGVSICNSWINAVNPGQQIHAHIHTNSYISGCFYLTEGAPIEFFDKGINDRIFSFMPEKVFDKNNFRTWTSAFFSIEPGTLLLFPSELYHAVRKHEGNAIRLSIAFNAIPKGAFGIDGRRMNLIVLDDV